MNIRTLPTSAPEGALRIGTQFPGLKSGVYPSAEVRVLDAGYFALDTKADEIAALVRAFMQKQK